MKYFALVVLERLGATHVKGTKRRMLKHTAAAEAKVESEFAQQSNHKKRKQLSILPKCCDAARSKRILKDRALIKPYVVSTLSRVSKRRFVSGD